eukprot:g3995.t1
MEGATRSPIYSSFSETLAGLQTIRAWGLQDSDERFRHEHLQRVKENGRFFFTAEMSSVWIMLRLELFTVVLIGSFSFMAVLFHGLQLHVDGPQIGIALVYAIQMTALFQRNAQLVMLVGQMLTACERVLSFEEVEQEPALVAPSDQDLMNWPEGSIEFEEVSMKYRDGDLVLKKASFTVDAGTRVGVCGRSGAGKSSLVAVLFRVVDPCHGAVRVDGVDIATLGLHTLRRNFGSLRFNLDPFQQISEDEELLQALKKVGLVGLDLEMRIAEQGENLSQGQRQLLCIARVFAAPTRILVLDEATSAMDSGTRQSMTLHCGRVIKTDEFIKELLRTTWSEGHHTVLTIAHRLGTIIDYDKILVLASGEVAEFDTPQELRRRPKGHFAQMWRPGVPQAPLKEVAALRLVPMAVAYWETVGCNVAVYSLGTGHQAMDQHEVEVLLRRFPTREMRKMMIAMQMEEPEEIDTISEGKQPTVMNNIFWVATHSSWMSFSLRLGAGSGEWVAAQAEADRQCNWVALELMRDRAHSILRRASLQGLRKLCILSGDALQMLRHLVPSTSVSHVFVNFPEPPFVSGEVAESTYHMMTSELFEEMHRVLQKGCQITILSDNHRYMQSLAQTATWLRSRLDMRDVWSTRTYRVVTPKTSSRQAYAACAYNMFM